MPTMLRCMCTVSAAGRSFDPCIAGKAGRGFPVIRTRHVNCWSICDDRAPFCINIVRCMFLARVDAEFIFIFVYRSPSSGTAARIYYNYIVRPAGYCRSGPPVHQRLCTSLMFRCIGEVHLFFCPHCDSQQVEAQRSCVRKETKQKINPQQVQKLHRH